MILPLRGIIYLAVVTAIVGSWCNSWCYYTADCVRSAIATNFPPHHNLASSVFLDQYYDAPPPPQTDNILPVVRRDYVDGNDAFSTAAVQCRLDMEEFQRRNINQWLQNAPYPMVEWVWKMNTNGTSYLGMMNILRDHGQAHMRARQVVEEFCEWIWQDQYGTNFSVGDNLWRMGSQSARVYFTITPPMNGSVPTKMWPVVDVGHRKQRLKIPIVYDLEPYITCNEIEQAHPPAAPLALTSGSTNKQQPKKIGACLTRFWGQYDLLPEWIAYHRMIGIEHFWLFVGEEFDNIQGKVPSNESDITYVPYNYNWKNHKKKVANASEIARENEPHFEETFFQVAANNQCLYMAKQYGFDWIITPDIDEFVVLSQQDDSTTVVNAVASSPLQEYLDRYNDQPEIGEVCLSGASYGRHPELEPNQWEFQLAVDFTYRRDKALGTTATATTNNNKNDPSSDNNGNNDDDEFSKEDHNNDGRGAGGRRKCFYRAQLVTDILVHGKAAQDTSNSADANPNDIELHHYRSPLLGPAEITNTSQLVSYPQFRNQYRHKIVAALQDNNWSFPNFFQHMDPGYSSLQDKPKQRKRKPRPRAGLERRRRQKQLENELKNEEYDNNSQSQERRRQRRLR